MLPKEITIAPVNHQRYFDRDISWLSFNERVLMEAERESLPLMERMNFLSIYSSNLDEFYRVRMPVLNALHKLHKKKFLDKDLAEKHADVAALSSDMIAQQLNRFGLVLQRLIPELEAHDVYFLYGKNLPQEIMPQITHYFFTQVLAFLKPVLIQINSLHFFPENNQLYLAVTGRHHGPEEALLVVNIPTEELPRFYETAVGKKQYVVFLDDIIKAHLHILTNMQVEGCYSFKVTRDADLALGDIYEQDLAAAIEAQVAKRDLGLATRFLYEPGLPEGAIERLLEKFGMEKAVVVEGGAYHNLRDLNLFSVKLPDLYYTKWPQIQKTAATDGLLLEQVAKQDIMLHTPYHSYDMVLRFFNEAAIAADVTHIYITMYRVASSSRIVNALISAAHNGKKVTVVVELKARFDEANNLKWAKRLKEAGVQVLYTHTALKVHAKIALVKRKNAAGSTYLGLLATGNLNEVTARFYTDHVLLTGQQELLKEVKKLFSLMKNMGETMQQNKLKCRHLLVAQVNLHERLLELIDREIVNAGQGLPARVIIKLNNLEERVLIEKLYEASAAGVQIQLIIRGICCLIPGVVGMSEHISVRRIVDRYLEHGRVYIFHNNGMDDLFLGSADWMNRNIYKRIEVCFPVYDKHLKTELIEMIALQLKDNTQAVMINESLENVLVTQKGPKIQSQSAIYSMLQKA
ncbi:polyphosphate kinase 1 [Cesiribacter sp. SM1]|uniref:polyphosphate kinase 1 n=1 Tax=Cesiribacter sp. SM1 TaxID=2861196 RepID=UPI001CD3911F|nr:polyphosphate kinase 1 [Cesiribacter sp. SM1]